VTYGEAHIEEQWSMELVEGEWKQTVYIQNKPQPMVHKDAVKYYNTKLFAYWMDQLDDRLTLSHKKQIVSALMFGHIDKYKLFKEGT